MHNLGLPLAYESFNVCQAFLVLFFVKCFVVGQWIFVPREAGDWPVERGDVHLNSNLSHIRYFLTFRMIIVQFLVSM